MKEFYAVTVTSLYKIKISEHGCIVMEKLGLRSRSNIPVGTIFTGGAQMLSIGVQLIFFTPNAGNGSRDRRIEFVSDKYWGSRTSSVVALFLKRENAEECFKSFECKVCDEHWLYHTKEVITMISEDDPHCSICHFPGMELVTDQ